MGFGSKGVRLRRPLFFFNLRRREISSPKAMRGVQAVVSMAHMQRPIGGKHTEDGWGKN